VCETWFLTARELRKLRAIGNEVLRRIFGLKREEETEIWQKNKWMI
jgi:hypothetical protein